MLSPISSSVAVIYQQAVSLPLSPSAQASRLPFPHPINAAQSNNLGWEVQHGVPRARRNRRHRVKAPLYLEARWFSSGSLLLEEQQREQPGGCTNPGGAAAVQGKQAGSSRAGCANKAPSLRALPEQLPPCAAVGQAGKAEQALLVRPGRLLEPVPGSAKGTLSCSGFFLKVFHCQHQHNKIPDLQGLCFPVFLCFQAS